MKSPTLVFIALTIVFFCCKNQNTHSNESNPATDSISVDVKPTYPIITCYEEISGKDTFYLYVERFETTAKGKMDYLFSEKDQSRGNFVGVMKGDTLIADYTFNAEGTTSVRQMVYLFFRDKAVEGYGPVVEENGRMRFKDLHALTFGEGLNLQQVECKE